MAISPAQRVPWLLGGFAPYRGIGSLSLSFKSPLMLGFYKIFIFSLKNLRPIAVAVDAAAAASAFKLATAAGAQLFFSSIHSVTTTIIKEIMALTMCHTNIRNCHVDPCGYAPSHHPTPLLLLLSL